VEIENPEEAVYRSLVPVMAKDETGNIVYASSAREMENILKLDSQYVRKAALTRGEQLYQGIVLNSVQRGNQNVLIIQLEMSSRSETCG